MERSTVELVGGFAVCTAGVALVAPAYTGLALGVATLMTIGPLAYGGLTQTLTFLLSMSRSKKHDKINGYNKQYDEKTSVEERSADYAALVDTYYDLATEFYEWGWGQSFHFADRRQGETFRQSMLRHEYYLAGRLGINKGAAVLDCGCGIGGPARSIARFTGAQIKAITINQFQVNRGNEISRREDLCDRVELLRGDFMEMPFPDASFDGVYAIESTCHAPDRSKVYAEIFRVLKPGSVFACYEWCLTDRYDPGSTQHRRIKRDIETGDGLPDLVHTSSCTKALEQAGFEVLEVRDCALDGHLEGGEAWYVPITPSWNPFAWPRFQFNPVMIRITPIILRFLEFIGVVPVGTEKTQVMLQAGGIGLAQGGLQGVFTPAWLMVGRKPF